MEFKTLSDALRYEVNKNRRNLENTGLWDFIHQDFDDMEDVQVRKFIKNYINKIHSAFYIVNDLFFFTPKSVAKALDIPIGTSNIISKASHLTMEEIQEIFEPNAMKPDGYSLLKSKGKWRKWLPFFNERILMGKRGTDRILATGLVVAVMAWNGFQLPWGSIIHKQMRVELCKKHSWI